MIHELCAARYLRLGMLTIVGLGLRGALFTLNNHAEDRPHASIASQLRVILLRRRQYKDL